MSHVMWDGTETNSICFTLPVLGGEAVRTNSKTSAASHAGCTHLSTAEVIANVLFAYHNATHATTNQTPAMLFLGRGLRSRLDLLKPNLQNTLQKRLWVLLLQSLLLRGTWVCLLPALIQRT